MKIWNRNNPGLRIKRAHDESIDPRSGLIAKLRKGLWIFHADFNAYRVTPWNRERKDGVMGLSSLEG